MPVRFMRWLGKAIVVCVAVVALVGLLAVAWRTFDLTGEVADFTLANARAPLDRELPLTAHALPIPPRISRQSEVKATC